VASRSVKSDILIALKSEYSGGPRASGSTSHSGIPSRWCSREKKAFCISGASDRLYPGQIFSFVPAAPMLTPPADKTSAAVYCISNTVIATGGGSEKRSA
jgi:hypothetical protein